MKEDKRQDNRYDKSDYFIAGITNVYLNVRGGCMWSSARMGYIDSLYGRVVVVRSWTFDESSWRRSSRGETARCLMLVSWDQSGRWIQLDDRCRQMRSVGSLWAAEIGRVVECSWTIVVGSWSRSSRWMQLDDRTGKLKSVESLWLLAGTVSHYVDWMLHCWSVVVGRSISRFWQYVGLTGGVSIWLLACNSESLCELDAALLG